MANSRRTNKFVGTKSVYNPKTGEEERAIIVQQRREDLNFVKLFLPEEGSYFMFPKEMISSAIDVFNYLLVISDKRNEVVLYSPEVEERIGLSQSSVSRGRSQLLALDFIRRRTSANYMINPAIACKVDGDKREKLFDIYAQYPRAKADK